MNDKFETLNKLSDSKLIDVVKNYKQYGYDDLIRDTAIQILSSRGIDEEILSLTGNNKNNTYDTLNESYNGFVSSSNVAIFLYILYLALFLASSIMHTKDETSSLILIILCYITMLLYLVFLVKANVNHYRFCTSVNKQKSAGEQVGYFLIGVPFQFLLYFYIKGKMREDMKMMN